MKRQIAVSLVAAMAFAIPLRGDALESLRGSLLSPDGRLEVYKLPEGTDHDAKGRPYDYGTRLFLRPTGASGKGILLRENGRWMAAQWAPRSHLLGVEDHSDGHVSKVFVYEAEPDSRSSRWICREIFRSPGNGYDVQWFIEGWDATRRLVRLRRQEIVHPRDAAGQDDFSVNGSVAVSYRTFRLR